METIVTKLFQLTHYLKDELSPEMVFSRISALITYVVSLQFDFEGVTSIVPFFGYINVVDELALGFIKLAFAVLTAMVVWIVTHYLKKFFNAETKKD